MSLMLSNSLNFNITYCLKNLTDCTVTLTLPLLPAITHPFNFLNLAGSSVVGNTLTSPLIPCVDVITPTLNISSFILILLLLQ